MDQVRIYPIACGLGFAFLIENSQGLYLVDSGSPDQEGRVLAKLRKLGRQDLKLIWITHAHYDHYGSAAALREKTGAHIGVHPADEESMAAGESPLGTFHTYGFIFPLAQNIVAQAHPLSATPPDFTLEDQSSLEYLGLDAAILHTPGHTPGHTCLLLNGGIVFAGDLFGQSPRLRRQSLLATDWDEINSSIEKLKSLRPEWVYSGHAGNPIRGSEFEKI
ncbi:MAG: MBL fold metallo-hydrolase [Anaerolineaceae bacterium]